MSNRSVIRRYPIASYFVLAYLISWGGSLIIGGPKFFRGETLELEDAILMAPIVIGGPLIAGIVMNYLVDGKAGLRDLLSRLVRWQVGLRWYLAALLTFPILIYVVLWGLSVLVSSDYAPGFISFGIMAGLFAGFLEEVGWMGFAYPRMQKQFGTWRATFYLAFLHGLWHAMAGYLGDSALFGAYWLPRFIAVWIVAMTAMRIILVWIYSNTGSLLLAQLTHASSTAFLIIFGPFGTPAQETLWSVVYAVVLWIPAAIIVARYGKSLVGRHPLTTT